MYQGKYYKGMTRAYSFQQKNSTKEITKEEQEYIYIYRTSHADTISFSLKRCCFMIGVFPPRRYMTVV